MSTPVRFQISMLLALLMGLAYVGWLAWAEGWRLLAVLGVMALVALIGGAVHMAMGMARSHDGLDGPARSDSDETREAVVEGDSK